MRYFVTNQGLGPGAIRDGCKSQTTVPRSQPACYSLIKFFAGAVDKSYFDHNECVAGSIPAGSTRKKNSGSVAQLVEQLLFSNVAL